MDPAAFVYTPCRLMRGVNGLSPCTPTVIDENYEAKPGVLVQ